MPYHSIDDPTKLRRVLEAVLLIERDLELPALLRHVIEEAASMTGARYAAVGVLNEDRTALAEFVTFGIKPEVVARIGPLPTGKGVLGTLIADPKPLRLARLGDHPDSFGFPPGHPPMTSFLGVPVKVRDEIYGNLYLTDKIGWSEFTTTMWLSSKHWPWPPVSLLKTPGSTNRSRLPPSMTTVIAWLVTCTIM